MRRLAMTTGWVCVVIGAALTLGALVSSSYGAAQGGPQFDFHSAWAMFWGAAAAFSVAIAITVNLN